MLSDDQAVATEPSICNYHDCFQDAWDDYVRKHRRATVFHLTAWKRVVERVFGLKTRYIFIEVGGAIQGVLPLFEVSNPLQGRTLISVPFAVYGGPCADNENAARALREAACRMAEQDGVKYLELRERAPVSDPGFRTKHLYCSFDIEFPDSAEELQKGFPRDTRYMIRKAQKNGLRAIVDSQYLDVFYDILSASYHHLGTPVFSKRLFKVILEEFGEDCELTTIWHKTKAVAAVMSFRFRDWIVPYFGGSYVEGRELAANNFMYWEVMKRGLETGARYFDFGRSKIGTGAYAFKTQWNMKQRELPYQFYLVKRKTMPNFSPLNPKFSLPISLWKSLPVSFTRVLGPAVIRWFP